MITIPELRTARFILSVHEMYMIDSIKLTRMPDYLEHKQVSFAIKAMTEQVEGIVTDIGLWTVQERMLAICHYIAGTQEDGHADFSVDELKFTDYLRADKPFSKQFYDHGVYEGDNWKGYPLLGYMAEEIERLYGEIENIDGKLHWITGCIACQLVPEGQELERNTENYSQELLKRMTVISQLAESDFLTLYAMLVKTNQELAHLFELEITDSGLVAVSREIDDGKGGSTCQYARFPTSSIVSEPARNLSKQLEQPSA